MRSLFNLTALVLALSCFASACSTTPETSTEKAELVAEAERALQTMRAQDPGLDTFLKTSHGYAIFPNVGKGGVVVGGAYGKGVVYEQGRQVGFASLSQATIGAQLGGQTFRELICFQTKDALDSFKNGRFAFAANASAVALKSGAAATAKYQNGVATFVSTKEGLMFEASLGGQSFEYEPVK